VLGSVRARRDSFLPYTSQETWYPEKQLHSSQGAVAVVGSSFPSKAQSYSNPETDKFLLLQDLLVVSDGMTCVLLYSITVTFYKQKKKAEANAG